MVIEALRAIQEEYGYIPGDQLVGAAARLKVPVSQLHAVASFYPHFRLQPPPKASVSVCRDLLCHLNGADALAARVRAVADERAGLEVRRCSCLGQCDQAPATLINDVPCPGGWSERVVEQTRRALAGEEVKPPAPVPAPGSLKTDPYPEPAAHYGVLRRVAAAAAADPGPEIVRIIEAAGLRGMGGTGRPAVEKWRPMLKHPPGQRYVICNADESEVGNFKDREILRLVPHLVVEAMAIAGLALGATKGYIYIRHEYHEQIEVLERELKRARQLGAIGPNVFRGGRSFDLQLFVSPGGYIMGEQTALLEAIEGRRGEPRNQKFDVGEERGLPHNMGLFGRPTLIHNVETLAYVPRILATGPQWFKDQGVRDCSGLKWVGICGHVGRPGVFEVPMGTTYAEVIEMAGGMLEGRKLKAIAPTGPTGGFFPASTAECVIDFPKRGSGGCSIGSAALMVLAEGTCLVDAALSLTRFYRNESCGKCVPCRVGSEKLVSILEAVVASRATAATVEPIARLGRTMQQASICGLGKVVDVPVRSVMQHFAHEWAEHVEHRTCPDGVCFRDGK